MIFNNNHNWWSSEDHSRFEKNNDDFLNDCDCLNCGLSRIEVTPQEITGLLKKLGYHIVGTNPKDESYFEGEK